MSSRCASAKIAGMVRVPCSQEGGGYLPAGSVRFPIRLRRPPGFSPSEPSTWPRIEGRLEYVGGRIEFMPPCGDIQQDVCVSTSGFLFNWAKSTRRFVVGGNEAGMLLGGDVRAADAAVWRAEDAGRRTGGFRRVPPVLAVEVSGVDEDESDLRAKAGWYLSAGVSIVWLVLPESREVVVLSRGGEARFRPPDRLPEHPALPGLAPEAREFFLQLDTAEPGR